MYIKKIFQDGSKLQFIVTWYQLHFLQPAYVSASTYSY